MNAFPLVGWLISFIFNASMAIPFWLIWTQIGIGEKYAYWLPEVYLHPTFWECVGIFIVMEVVKMVFVPKIVSVTQTNKDS